MKQGIVYLVGAGPGDPKLLTLRGRECLERADVVFYDALANPALLDYAPPQAKRVYVGKRADQHAVPQEELHERMVQAARAGKVVVRLKGGDPFLFGRGGEEGEALAQAGIPFEVVPGVTSALAAPAYAGIPVTHRRWASSVAIVTGHEDPTKPESAVRWDRLATAVDTLVVLMGMGRLEEIVEALRAAGRSPQTPAAVVEWGTWPRQRTATGTLETLVQQVRKQGLGAPAVVIVGEVVQLREALNWFESRPLFGKTIVVTRARAQASALSAQLEELGAEVLQFPTIRIEPPGDYGPLDEALSQLKTFDWVIFTSANAVETVWERLRLQGKDARALGTARVAAIGTATAQALQARGIVPDLLPSESRSEGLAEALSGQKPARILLPTAERTRGVLAQQLQEQGATVVSVVAYRTLPALEDRSALLQRLREGSVDVITFTSGSTVEYFVQAIGEEALPEVRRCSLVAIGPVTAETLRRWGLEPSAVAERPTIEELTQAILRQYQQSRRKEAQDGTVRNQGAEADEPASD